MDLDDVLQAWSQMHEAPYVSARDAIHVAVMRHHGIDTILSFDKGYDAISGVNRIAG